MPIGTLLDIARIKTADPVVGLIEENLASAPEIGAIFSRTIPGISYNTLVASGRSSGAFRALNSGVTLNSVPLRSDLVQCFAFENPIEVDAMVNSASQGLGFDEIAMIFAKEKLKSTMQDIGRQIFAGTAADSRGFAGLKQFIPKTYTAGTTASQFFIDATGTTANTASSIYAIRSDLQDVSLIYGGGDDGTFRMREFIAQQLTDASGGRYMGQVSSIYGWIGLQIGRSQSAGRIGNITRESGKTATDTLLSQLVALFPTGAEPTHILMSRRSAAQVAASRPRTGFFTPGTAPKATVAGTSYTVSEYEGIPVIVTDSIPDTDAIE